ncbi:hypothetical protein [Aquibacillus saliphilus]|uniref:hypothetical protein n=1 Tax=Aquibacillus saliphilus TaxID=1909422 RepID=UPI001CF0AA18|nr:hypothetical protein [Aquibacillus saliphilus]
MDYRDENLRILSKHNYGIEELDVHGKKGVDVYNQHHLFVGRYDNHEDLYNKLVYRFK